MYKQSKVKNFPFLVMFVSCCFVFGFAITSFAQSTERIRPTPIISNNLQGEIRARDIGDSRLTTFYYIFNGKRGDIFINVLTKNLNGDIEIFTSKGLKSRTKITLYADAANGETGRVVYMRKPESLVLRVQGRTPNDDPATFQIKFAGSFAPMPRYLATKKDKLPEIDTSGQGSVKVNSVGTIIEDEKNPDDDSKKLTADTKNDKASEKAITDVSKTSIPTTFDPRKKSEQTTKPRKNVNRPRLVITDPFPRKEKDTEIPNITVAIKKKPLKSALITIERVPDDKESSKMEAARKAKAIAEIQLVILLKNGKKFTRRMSKVSSVNVFDGVLKVVGTDGKVRKFSIFDVAKMTIE